MMLGCCSVRLCWLCCMLLLFVVLCIGVRLVWIWLCILLWRVWVIWMCFVRYLVYFGLVCGG